MGFLKSSPPRTQVEVMQSTHGSTFVTWPPDVSGADLPALPVGHAHPQSRHWVMADRTAVLILNGDPTIHEGGVIRHTFEVVEASWNRKTKTLNSRVKHPSDPEVTFVISTNGKGCNCNQGVAGSAGPINAPYQINMVNPASSDEYSWFTAVPA